MWGTDGVRVFTLETGGAGSSRRSNTGTRSAWGGTQSREPLRGTRIAQGLERLYGSCPTSLTRQYLSDHWIRYWGIHPSRLSRTGNERCGGAVYAQGASDHGRIFQNLAVRVAVADFVERYNRRRLEKLHTPIEAREE